MSQLRRWQSEQSAPQIPQHSKPMLIWISLEWRASGLSDNLNCGVEGSPKWQETLSTNMCGKCNNVGSANETKWKISLYSLYLKKTIKIHFSLIEDSEDVLVFESNVSGFTKLSSSVWTEKDSVRFEVFHGGVFWDVTPCGCCNNRRFGGT
jgi:hypothetical protein